jgi:hypothetical protein
MLEGCLWKLWIVIQNRDSEEGMFMKVIDRLHNSKWFEQNYILLIGILVNRNWSFLLLLLIYFAQFSKGQSTIKFNYLHFYNLYVGLEIF